MFDIPELAPAAWFPTPSAARLFSVIALAWAAAEVVNLVVGRRAGGLRGGQDRGSAIAIVAAVAGSVAAGYWLRAAGVGVADGAQFVGMALMAVGIGLRQWAVGVLGRHFSVAVVTDARQRLVTSGPYQWVRHPSYTGAMMTLVGLPLALGAPLGAPLAAAAALAAYQYRASVEERALERRFGEAYRAYASGRPRFFPGL